MAPTRLYFHTLSSTTFLLLELFFKADNQTVDGSAAGLMGASMFCVTESNANGLKSLSRFAKLPVCNILLLLFTVTLSLTAQRLCFPFALFSLFSYSLF